MAPLPSTVFNADPTVGDQDTFVFPAIAAGLNTVFGLNVKLLASKTDAGARSAAAVIKSAGTVGVGSSVALSGAQVVPAMFTLDPHTAAQWTQTAVNAANPGYKVTA